MKIRPDTTKLTVLFFAILRQRLNTTEEEEDEKRKRCG